jgi:hypothetical protein
MFISDIGQEQIDEVNIGVAGGNYGWPLREGTFAHSPDDRWGTGIADGPDDPTLYADSRWLYSLYGGQGPYLDPIGQYDHEESMRGGLSLASIGGAFLYEGDLLPALDGMVLLSDLVSGRIFYFDPLAAIDGPATLYELLLTLDGDPVTLLSLEGYSNRVDLRLGRDASGELYMITKGYGDIYRFLGMPSIPEPATWLAMIAGFALTGMALRRQRVRLA